MDINISNADLTFGDFALLSILLMLMYAVSMLGALLGPSAAGIPLQNRKAAVTWSFAGVIATVGAGVLADSVSSDLPLLGIPLFFILMWAYSHFLSNKLIDVQILVRQVDKAYEETIVEILPTDAGAGLLAVEVLQRAVTTNVYFSYLSRGGALAKSVAPLAVGELVTERLLPSLERTEALLAELEKSKMIKQVNGRYIRLAPPPKQ